MDIKIYSTQTCPYCRMAKEYLSSKGKSYTEFDLAKDEAARKEMVKLSGQMGVPVIVIDGKVIVGFDKEEIDKSIG